MRYTRTTGIGSQSSSTQLRVRRRRRLQSQIERGWFLPLPLRTTCSPHPSSGPRGRSLRKPCGSPPSQVLRVRKTAPPSVCSRLWFSSAAAFPLSRAEMVSSPGFLGNPFGSMPRARDSGDPATTSQISVVRMLPSALLTASASQRAEFSELNLHGLLPCCVRFAPTSRPANGNTRYRPACLLWPCGTRTRWIPLRGFHRLIFGSSPSTLFPAR